MEEDNMAVCIVIRRVGGLEVVNGVLVFLPFVIRRVGGLEVCGDKQVGRTTVIRRVGGLEVHV